MLERDTTQAVETTPSEAEVWDLVAQTAHRRAATYGLLARLYRVEVDDGLLKELRGMRMPAKTGNARMDEGYRALGKFLGGTTAGTELELRRDYVRAFIGEGTDGKSAAYPLESVYTSENRLRMQDARDEVLALYRSEGLNRSESWHDDEDHVALELEFMQFLCDKLARAVEDGDTAGAKSALAAQRGFLTDHLCNWVPLMTQDMRRFAKTGFYRGLAALTDGYLETEGELLDELLGITAGGDE